MEVKDDLPSMVKHQWKHPLVKEEEPLRKTKQVVDLEVMTIENDLGAAESEAKAMMMLLCMEEKAETGGCVMEFTA